MIATDLNHDDLDIRNFEEGDAILTEGEVNSSVYLLKDGAVSITISGEEICRECTPDATFGEISALIGVEASATVKAIEPSAFWVIKDFRTYLNEHPQCTLGIAEELANRLNNMSLNFIEVRSTLQALQEANKPEHDEPKKIVLDKGTVDEIKRLREERSSTDQELTKVDKILRIRIDN